MNLIAQLQHSFATYAQRPALRNSQVQWTYAQLEAAAAAIQQQLPENQTCIGLWTGTSAGVYAALLGTLAAGRAYVPVHHQYPPERNQSIVQQAGLQTVVGPRAHPALQQLAETMGLRIIDPYETEGTDGLQLSWASVEAQDLAYILFTSGSTGQPKGVPIHHGALAAFFDALDAVPHYQISPEDRVLQMFELTFDLSVYSTLAPWRTGALCYLPDPASIGALGVAEALDEGQLTVALMVPSILAYLKPYLAEIELPALRLSLFCGEALPHELALAWSQCCPRAVLENVYGPTEATIFISRYPWQAETSAAESVHGVVPIGRELPYSSLLVADEAGTPVPDGHEGELLLLGPQLSTGYWQLPERSAQAFVLLPDGRRAYRTGDRVKALPSGALAFLGRLDHQVKIDGYRVELGEVENVLRGIEGVEQAAVLATGPAQRQQLLAFAVAPSWNAVQLLDELKTRLAPYMQPRELLLLPALPLNASGKVDRKALESVGVAELE